MYREPAIGVVGSARTFRCAVYTRKSTDEGLDQAFNSLDAQREACEAYIASQRHEGWACLPDRYDDGGYSGGSMERPALKRLLDDVARGKIDVVVLYKIDRLTRALSDFARIVEVLDKAGASFVSVTQAFNTTTSMGRLTLNVLLSFAQFEREVGAERVRDKIAASKKRGMWMGGVCPIGFDAIDRKLIVNQTEAKTVRLIFELYLTLGSVLALRAELQNREIVSKLRLSRNGRHTGGMPFTRGALYVLLRNRLYVGEVSHRGSHYPGGHDAIIDHETLGRAQQLLNCNRVERLYQVNAKDPSLLAGIVWDERGRRMSPSHTVKGARRYRYYASKITRPDDQHRQVRLAAAALEQLVALRIGALLRDQNAIDAAIEPFAPDGITTEAILFAVAPIAVELIDAPPSRVRALLLDIIKRIDVGIEEVVLQIDPAAFYRWARLAVDINCPPITLSVPMPARFKHRSHHRPLIISEGAITTSNIDPTLLKLIAKAHAARAALFAGGGRSVQEVAAAEGYDTDYFTVLVKLAFLAPDISTAILDGRQPAALTRQTLARIRNLPMTWGAQRLAISVKAGLT